MLEILVEDFLPPTDIVCINTRLKPNVGWNLGNRMYWAKKIQDQSCEVTRIAEFYPKELLTPVYLVTVPDIEGFFKSDWVTALPEPTVEKLIKHNIPILLSQPDEYFVRYDRDQLRRFDQALRDRGLNTNTVITHSINLSYNADREIDIGERKIVNFYSYGWLNTASINRVKDSRLVDKDRDYLCINRTMRDIRSLFYLNYLDRGDNAYVSFFAEYGSGAVTGHMLGYRFNLALQYLDAGLQTKLASQVDSAVASVPRYLDSEENQQAKGISNVDLEYLRKKVWFEIVTETHDIDHDPNSIAILTEKTLYPIASGLPFIVLGHKKVYQLLTELGFQLYDFDYDPDCSLSERFQQLNRFLDRFKSWSVEERQTWLSQQQQRIDYNQDLLYRINWTQLESKTLESGIRTGQWSRA